MKLKRINNLVSIHSKPVFGTVKAEKRVMALSIDKETKKPYIGLAREITRSQGTPDQLEFIDESKLIIVKSNDLLKWKKHSDLKIKDIEKIIKKLTENNKYFIGLEDPDIWNEDGIKHVYFTIAFKYKEKHGFEIYLGHAQGEDLENLTATLPVLSPIPKKNIMGFKEISISPIETTQGRLNLNEVGIEDKKNKKDFSAIALTHSRKIGKPFRYVRTVINPQEMPYHWIRGHASPCCFLPEDFLTYSNLLVGIINGREPSRIVNGEKIHGKFRPGFILFNPKTGEIPWIDSEPFLEDPDARTITFASDFVKTGKDRGILYCHINDSFVRAYEINLKELEKYLKQKIKL